VEFMMLPHLFEEELLQILSLIHCKQWNEVGHLGEAVNYDSDLGVPFGLR